MEANGRKHFRRFRIFGSLALCLWAVTGCGVRDYMEMYDLPAAGWHEEEAIVFTFVPDSAAIQGRGATTDGEWIDITVRHEANFPYADLPLEIKGVTPDKQFWIDTVDFALGVRGEAGAFQWAGQRYSNHYDITRRYRSGIRYRTFPGFAGRGEYAISIRQLTGEEPLKGILAVGVIASGAHTAQPR